jgi:hypothetical protein
VRRHAYKRQRGGVPFFFDSSTIKKANEDNSRRREMSTTHLGVVGADNARSAPLLVTT